MNEAIKIPAGRRFAGGQKSERLQCDLSDLIMGAQIPVVECDKRMVITRVNVASEHVFGYCPDELVGQRVNVLMLPGEANAHDGYVAAYERTGVKKILSTAGRIVQGRHKNGKTLSLKMTTSATPVGYAAVFVDVTETIHNATVLAAEKAKAESQMHLLRSILPAEIVQKLMDGEVETSEHHEAVTIVFADIVGWTRIAAALPPRGVVNLLNHIFSTFDDLAKAHDVYKVKTIGDAYMAAAGHQNHKYDHPLRIIRFALAMIQATLDVPASLLPGGFKVEVRVGVHTGPVCTGVVGRDVPHFDFFGDAVNVAARMESHGVPGCIHMSDTTASALLAAATTTAAAAGDESMGSHGSGGTEKHDARLIPALLDGATIRSRGIMTIKGKGPMATHLICPRGVGAPLLDPHASVPSFVESATADTRHLWNNGASATGENINGECSFGPPGFLPEIKSARE